MQPALFHHHDEVIRPELPGADLALWPAWLAPDEADAVFEALRTEIPFEQHRLQLFGRAVDAPRLSCWIGEPHAVYLYSGTRFEPHPWTPVLAQLRERVQQACAARFDSVLANLYRDGNDAMGWHSDDEPELGPAPVIASLSLGASRRFKLRAREAGGAALDLELAHGSLLCMRGQTQQHYRHALPRSKRVQAPRLNLTFRRITGEHALGIAPHGRR